MVEHPTLALATLMLLGCHPDTPRAPPPTPTPIPTPAPGPNRHSAPPPSPQAASPDAEPIRI